MGAGSLTSISCSSTHCCPCISWDLLAQQGCATQCCCRSFLLSLSSSCNIRVSDAEIDDQLFAAHAHMVCPARCYLAAASSVEHLAVVHQQF